MRDLYLAADPWVRSFLLAWFLLVIARELVLLVREIGWSEAWRWFCAGLQVLCLLPWIVCVELWGRVRRR
jgi:hypothetical protein